MFFYKRALSLIFILLLAVALIACGNNDSSSSAEEGNDVPETTTLRFAGTYATDHIITKTMEIISDEVFEKTDGEVEITTYPADQLGGYTSVIEEVMGGTIEMALIPMISDHVQMYELIYLPFLASNYDEAKTVFSEGSELFDIFKETSKENNMEFLGFHADGFTGIGSTEEIPNPISMDEKDILLRIASLKSYEKTANKLGFNVMSIPYEDIYTSLQTGIIDATMGQSPSTMYTGFRDVVSYYYKYNDFFDIAGLIMNEEVWNKLSDENRDVVKEVITTHLVNSFDLAEEEENKHVEALKDYGIEVIEFSNEELKQLSEEIKSDVWEELSDSFEEGIIDRIRND